MSDTTPELGAITRTSGVAGQFSYRVPVTYPGEGTRTVEFVGSEYGGPITMISNGNQTFVSEPERFGEFSPTWVRRFFGAEN
ncbi:hypothetical protein GS896_25505 [Rhodococcus hoagii]|nr:hypothetical protein [Prescottella equi]MBM4654137.1 hypothetical protein [Prescottella equi]NKR23409.1 hypothetical protein [Prescottella equi]NKT55979.1 hypothetical protein [Prescottella equi]NKU37396.1 hypothetical protein [Prescottella equi]